MLLLLMVVMMVVMVVMMVTMVMVVMMVTMLTLIKSTVRTNLLTEIVKKEKNSVLILLSHLRCKSYGHSS